MSSKVIIEGFDFRLCDFETYQLTNLGIDTGHIDDEEPMTDTIDNVIVKIYSHTNRFTLEEANEALTDKYFGTLSVTSQDYGYSEYTIEGFNVYEVKVGNHDLLKILNSDKRYKIVTIERAFK